MRRSTWATLTCICTILAMIAPLLGKTSFAQADIVPQRSKLFVFIQGFDTSLQNNDPPADTFGKANGIASYLSATYPGSAFLMYSYNGDTSDGDPLPYECQDTFTNGTTRDVLQLGKQLQDYLKEKQDTDVYLIAHSFGGLVAYGYLSYLMIQHIENGSIPGTIGDKVAGVVTLDSPLGGVPDVLHLSRKLLPYVYTSWCPRLIGRSTPAIDDLFKIYAEDTVSPYGGRNSIARVIFDTNRTNQDIAATASAQAIHTLTIGNTDDYIYDPAACKLLLGISIPLKDEYLSTQWVSDQGDSSGIYGRSFQDGQATCNNLTDLGINHGLVFSEQGIQTALGQFVDDQPLTALATASNEP
jgi:pimeloyl-ACP methyl ester carboxylesterase